jgi:hypothetical protein
MDRRAIRSQNYAVKKRNDFQCSECERDDQILVVTEGKRLTTRCPKHLGKLKPRPFQFNEGLEAP